jgi:hypothetical protein
LAVACSGPQSNELTACRGTAELVQHFRLYAWGGHIGARALFDISLKWISYTARLSQRGGGGYFTRSNYHYLPSLCLEEVGGQHTVSGTGTLAHSSTKPLAKFIFCPMLAVVFLVSTTTIGSLGAVSLKGSVKMGNRKNSQKSPRLTL